jgi:type II secretory pathway component GspD/PulD (secretin)
LALSLLLPGLLFGQTQPQQPQAATQPATATKPAATAASLNASKLYLDASKLFEQHKFEEAMRLYQQAAQLDPTKRDYPLSAEVARNHAVTALLEGAAKDRALGDQKAASAKVAHALRLNPESFQAREHAGELAGPAPLPHPTYEMVKHGIGESPELTHSYDRHSFHLHTDLRQVMQQVFKAYGVDCIFDESVRPNPVHFDLDEADFEQVTNAFALLFKTFYQPLDAHRVLVARDSRENRQMFERQNVETVYLSGLTAAELADLVKMAKDAFGAQQAAVDASQNAITLRGSDNALDGFNATLGPLLQGHNQMLLDLRLIQLAHSSTRNSGAQLPQTFTAYNLYTEEQAILNANQSLVQQIISSGLASASDPLAIIAILVASGQVSSSLFSNGIATFGGGLTSSALAPGSTTLNLALNSSDSKALDQVTMRLGDGEDAKLRIGERYPITTSQFSSSLPTSAIAGLTGAGSSSSLTSLLSSLTGGVSNIPMIEYQDLGLTLKLTAPKIMRSGDVALNITLQITALGGTSVNDVPILDNQDFETVVTLKDGETIVVASEIDKTLSNALSGTPGLSEIPGLNNLTGVDKQKNTSTLLLLITPHVLRSTQPAGHTPIFRVEKTVTR